MSRFVWPDARINQSFPEEISGVRDARNYHSCEVSVSVFLGATSDVDWPLWIEGYQSTRAVALSPGDGVLYRGIECAHWREAFSGQDHAQLFLHYVDRNGPYAGFKFDQKLWNFPFPKNVQTGTGDSTT